MDIQAFREKYSDGFNKGDHIIIQEKIDGANSSFQYDDETNSIKAFSRKQELGLGNNLRGFWEWTQQKLDLQDYKDFGHIRVFGEWLVSHSVPYPQDKYQKFYCYDLFDTETQTYYPQCVVKTICKKNNLIYVPVFYDGVFQSWEHCLSFVGQTELEGKYGEGIVIKNMTRLNDPNNRLPFYTKIVGEKFQEKAERKIKKPLDPDVLALREYNTSLVESIVTEARVNKILHKLVDEDILREDWDEHDMSIIAKNINSAIYYDCVKEENDIVLEVGEQFGKIASSITMRIVRDILKTR
jgi:hypothetical protein